MKNYDQKVLNHVTGIMTPEQLDKLEKILDQEATDQKITGVSEELLGMLYIALADAR